LDSIDAVMNTEQIIVHNHPGNSYSMIQKLGGDPMMQNVCYYDKKYKSAACSTQDKTNHKTKLYSVIPF